MNLEFAIIAAYKKAQELTYRFSGNLKDEKMWYEMPFFKGLDKAVVKSIWRNYAS